MFLTFLGTGTSQGIPVVTCDCSVCSSDDIRDKRFRTSALIETAKSTLVIDAGPDFRMQMLRASVKKIDAVLLTHGHHDHVSGLDDVRAYNFAQKMPIPVYGNSTCLSSVKRYFDYAFSEMKYPGVPEFKLIEIDNDSVFIGELEIKPIPVKHGQMSILGFRIGKLAYITDASYISEETFYLLENLDVLIINALRHKSHHSHFSISEAVDIIQKVKPKRAYLTHISHAAGRHIELMNELPDGIEPAYDGLRIEV